MNKTMQDYNDFILGKLKEMIHDALDSEAAPSEIYDTIIQTINEDIEYFQNCVNKRKSLMSLIKNKSYTAIVQRDHITNDFYIHIPEELNWNEDDIVEIIVNDGSIIAKKITE